MPAQRDFEIGNKKFKLCKIDAFKQFHIARRVGPLLLETLPASQGQLKDIKAYDALPEAEKLELFTKVVNPLMNGLAKLSDKDAELVLYGLLSSVETQQEAGNWARVATADMLMIQDFDLPILLGLAGRAFMYNLSNFFTVLPQATAARE